MNEFVKNRECWWCKEAGNSAEHKHKRTDIVREYGAGPYKNDNALLHITEEDINYIRGPNSIFLKFNKYFCEKCNNVRSKPFDSAYTIFIEYIRANEIKILKSRSVDLDVIFGKSWESEIEKVKKYFLKHLGCRIAELNSNFPIPIIEILNGQKQTSKFFIKLCILPDVLMHIARAKNKYDMFCDFEISKLRGNQVDNEYVYEDLMGYYRYSWLSIDYLFNPSSAKNLDIISNNPIKLDYLFGNSYSLLMKNKKTII